MANSAVYTMSITIMAAGNQGEFWRMKKHQFIKANGTRKHMIVGRPVSLASISYDDFYEDNSDRWQEKARRLQARRWRKIRHQTI